ncbi:glycosyltransferase family 4 protein [Ornithinimicrobium sp. Arc0846-15]|nr:glycosyltransferase family 4 protein [Ornithinimicrobium laminariae]
MKVGLVNPYAIDVPGGVQQHVLELADWLRAQGHEVSVLAPADDESALPEGVTSAGGTLAVRYNGSVARLAFGPLASARTRRWVTEGGFDVVHIHEPASPSVSLLALWAMTGPVVATFHSSQIKSRALRLAGPMLQAGLDKISARIAVSEEAARTVSEQLGGPSVVIPNGLNTAPFSGLRDPEVRSTGGPNVLFLGRFTEPRKGLAVLLKAWPAVLAQQPAARLDIAGPGEIEPFLQGLTPETRASIRLHGSVSAHDKEALLADTDIYAAPNTGGESFGIILTEALAAGAPIIASDLVAFSDVLDPPLGGQTFPNGDSDALAAAISDLWCDPAERQRLSNAGPGRASHYDWAHVGERILAVYDSVRGDGAEVTRYVPVARRRRGRRSLGLR